MRAVDESASSAFFSGEVSHISSNTAVSNGRMWLHGNLIAEIRGDRIFFNLCGWVTRTTLARLNGLLSRTSSYTLHVEDGEPKLSFKTQDGKPRKVSVPSSGWFDPESICRKEKKRGAVWPEPAVRKLRIRKEAA